MSKKPIEIVISSLLIMLVACGEPYTPIKNDGGIVEQIDMTIQSRHNPIQISIVNISPTSPAIAQCPGETTLTTGGCVCETGAISVSAHILADPSKWMCQCTSGGKTTASVLCLSFTD